MRSIISTLQQISDRNAAKHDNMLVQRTKTQVPPWLGRQQ